MTSPYILSNVDLQYLQSSAGQDYFFAIAFLNPVSITTTWNDLSTDAQGNWLPPPNVDTCATHTQPYQPTANLGPNRIGFVGEPLYFDGSRSTQRFDLPASNYTWGYSGTASMTLYSNGAQASIAWSAPGLYQVELTVTDRYGGSSTGIRQVMIYPDRDSTLPGVISISGLAGSLGSNGWTCQLTTVNSQISLYPPDLLPVGTYQPIVLFCETRYEVQPDLWVNATIGPNGNFSPGYPYQDPRILFDGYVQSGTIHQDADKDTLSFVCQGPQLIINESQTHQVGYYNTTYKTYSGTTPTSCNTTPNGQGFLVGGLMTADVVHSLLQTHSNIGRYHDIHVWNSLIPASVFQSSTGSMATYNLIYSTLGIVEGTLGANLTDLVANEWGQWYGEHDGSLRFGPQVNYRGSDYWASPQSLGAADASAFINFVQDLGYTVGDSLDGMSSQLPVIPALPIPTIGFVHPWGSIATPTGVWTPYGSPQPTFLQGQGSQNGPPITCLFSDIPTPDVLNVFEDGLLFPWVQAGGPQDLSIQPISFDFTENYSGRTGVVKLIGTLYGQTSLWVSWWPQNAFKIIGTGGGTSSLVASTLPSGNWLIDQSHVLPDISTQQNLALMSNWWWEMARRVYYAANVAYSGTITLGMATFCTLGDIVAVTRANNALGEHWQAKPFFVSDISYTLDMTQRTWQTILTVQEVTSILMGPITNPPAGLPKGYV